MVMLAGALTWGTSVPAFNYNDQHDLAGIVDGLGYARMAGILLVSRRAIEYSSIELLFDIFGHYRRRASIPLWIELDHCDDPVLIRRAVELGFDAVMADFSALPLADNIRRTASVVAELAGSGCLVEGEVSPIPDSMTAPDDGRELTSTEDLARFVGETRVDLVAPNLGTIHGFSRAKPPVRHATVAALTAASSVPVVAHGCDFLSTQQLKLLVRAGVRKLNLGPELRVAFQHGLQFARSRDHSDEPDQRLVHRSASRAVARRVKRLTAVLSQPSSVRSVTPRRTPLAPGDTPCVVAIDIGATKLAAALIEPTGRMIEQRRCPTPPPGSATGAWDDLAQLVDDVLRAASGPVIGVGVGSAGPVDAVTGTVSPVKITSWRNFPLAERLTALVGGLPVRVAGDGTCAAVGEHWLGAARGLDDVLVLVASTGVGGGIIQGGRLHLGRSGNAGHVGHVVVNLDGDQCPCGGRGCVATMASGPAMVEWAVGEGWPAGTASPTAVDLATAARAGSGVARAAFDRAARGLAAGIVSVAVTHDLRHAVIAGGLSNTADLLLPRLRRALTEYAHLEFVRGLEVRIAALGAASGLYGAAALIVAPDRYSQGSRTGRRS